MTVCHNHRKVRDEMSESAPETGTEPQQTPAETAPETSPPQQAPPAEDYEAKWKGQQKVNRDLERKLEQARTANMNETEKVVHEAEQRGRSAAAQDFGQHLARTEFDAIAARRNPDFKTADVLEYVDMSKMLGDDGDVNTKAIEAAVKRLVPEPSGGAPGFEGGSMTPPTQTNSFGDKLRSELRNRG